MSSQFDFPLAPLSSRLSLLIRTLFIKVYISFFCPDSAALFTVITEDAYSSTSLFPWLLVGIRKCQIANSLGESLKMFFKFIFFTVSWLLVNSWWSIYFDLMIFVLALFLACMPLNYSLSCECWKSIYRYEILSTTTTTTKRGKQMGRIFTSTRLIRGGGGHTWGALIPRNVIFQQSCPDKAPSVLSGLIITRNIRLQRIHP